jgi:hypothetical protein
LPYKVVSFFVARHGCIFLQLFLEGAPIPVAIKHGQDEELQRIPVFITSNQALGLAGSKSLTTVDQDAFKERCFTFTFTHKVQTDVSSLQDLVLPHPKATITCKELFLFFAEKLHCELTLASIFEKHGHLISDLSQFGLLEEKFKKK